MPSLMDKLSDQLEYHRISAKYTAKRKPLKNTKKGSSSRSDYPVNVMYRDNATYSRDIYSDNSRSYFDEPLSKSSQVSRLGRSNTYSAPSRSPEYYNNHRNVITTRNIAGTSQRKNIGIQFDRKTHSVVHLQFHRQAHLTLFLSLTQMLRHKHPCLQFRKLTRKTQAYLD